MFFLILSIIAFMISGFFVVRTWNKRDRYSGEITGESFAARFCFVLVFTFAFFSVIVPTAVVQYDQINDIERIEQVNDQKAIYTTRANDLVDRFQSLLAQQYPDYEKTVFKNMTPENADWVFIKYPELKGIQAYTKLVDQIKNLRDIIYQQDIKIAKIHKNMRLRARNPFLITWFLPSE